MKSYIDDEERRVERDDRYGLSPHERRCWREASIDMKMSAMRHYARYVEREADAMAIRLSDDVVNAMFHDVSMAAIFQRPMPKRRQIPYSHRHAILPLTLRWMSRIRY